MYVSYSAVSELGETRCMQIDGYGTLDQTKLREPLDILRLVGSWDILTWVG